MKSGGTNTGVVQEVENGYAVEVGDSDGAAETKIDERFHCGPGFLDGGVGLDDVCSFDPGVEPARWVADCWVDVFQGNCCHALSVKALRFGDEKIDAYGSA